MGRPKEKWTLREALIQIAPTDIQDEYSQLEQKWRGAPWAWVVGAPPTKAGIERDRFHELDEPIAHDLVQRLRTGEIKSSAIDPLEGEIPIRREVWQILEPDFVNSTATGGGKTFVGIRVWMSRPRPGSSRAEVECRKWLRQLAAEGYVPASKPALFKEATTKFRGLSERSFNRCWAKEAPPTWRGAGRRPRRRAAEAR